MPATNNLFSRMIEYTGNVIIGSGGLDMLIPTNGTLLVLQNVTWGGLQGFQRRPEKPVGLLSAVLKIIDSNR
jgi:carboxypeptidase D